MHKCIFFCALIFALCLGIQGKYSEAEVKDLFDQFISDHSKQYTSNAEYYAKLAVFSDNLELIEKMNSLGEATYAISKFSDLTPAEFKSQHLSSLLVNNAPLNSYPHHSLFDFQVTVEAPTAFDWRDKGAVTAIKDQASCGSCWAFSTIANIEGQHFLAGNPLITLSEEQIIECDDTDCGCLGGWPMNAFEWVIKAGGVESESAYPYCVPPLGKCYVCQADKNKTFCGPPPEYCNTTCTFNPQRVSAKISSWTKVSENETEIAAYLATHGPLSVALNAEWLQFYHSGVSDPLVCNTASLDHAVLIVGYGVEGDKPYWIVKNSWGPKWGEKGYFRIIRNKGKCGINTQVTTSIVSK